MGMMEGIELLLRRAQRFAGATEEEINEAGNLVAALAQFPLALDQAGAYIEEAGCSLGDYLQLYQAHRRTLLAWRGRQASRQACSTPMPPARRRCSTTSSSANWARTA